MAGMRRFRYKPQIDGDLFVPRASRVQTPAGVAYQPNQFSLDKGVNVLVVGLRRNTFREDRAQAALDRGGVHG